MTRRSRWSSTAAGSVPHPDRARLGRLSTLPPKGPPCPTSLRHPPRPHAASRSPPPSAPPSSGTTSSSTARPPAWSSRSCSSTGSSGPAAQFASFGTFAVGFLAGPIGGSIFGHFGDRLGRKKMLLLTLLIMGVGTAAIGLLPSYDAIGWWAPILLVTLRVLQGIGVGGEYGGAVLLAVEYAPPSGAAGSSAASRTSACPVDCCSPAARSRWRACCPTRRSSAGAGVPASWPACCCSRSAPTSGSR